MKDYIKELCIKKGIRPVYMKNKLTILSNGLQNGTPILRIHKIFANCSRKTAQAVVNYYFDLENRETYMKQIQNHTSRYFGSNSYKVAPLSDNFITALLILENNGKGDFDFNSSLKECPISSIIEKNMNGNHLKRRADGIVVVQEDNVTEIDIVVEP